MAFGVTLTGFNRKTLPDIKAELEADYKAAFGDVNTAPDSVFSQLIGPQAEQLDQAWQALEACYQAASPNGASAMALDNLVSLNDIARIAAAPTLVLAGITGDEGTLVPAGSRASLDGSGDLFEAANDATITAGNVIWTSVAVVQVENSTLYRIVINGNNYNYTSDGATSLAEIIAGLLAALVPADEVVAEDTLAGSIRIRAVDFKTAFSIDIPSVGADSNPNLGFEFISTPQNYTSVEIGPVFAPAGNLSVIETPISGWDSIFNFLDGEIGHLRETDKELKVRRLSTLRKGGSATLNAIKGKLLSGDVPGVVEAFVYENITMATDAGGRPPKSIQAIVRGGEDEVIARALHLVRGAGIETYGATVITFPDDQGFDQVVKFDRPTTKYAWVKATLTLYTEENFPDGGLGPDNFAAVPVPRVGLVAQALLAFGKAHGISQDFIVQRFAAQVFSVPGIKSVLIEIATTADATASGSYNPTLGTTDISVSPIELLDFDSTRIAVVMA